jgi:uncharacterized membrane protein YhaH (DUF805 family)
MTSLDKVWRALFIASAVVLGFSGFGQMPIYYRYYITSIPGLGWASSFYATQLVHYLAATLFLALVAFFVINHLLGRRRQRRLTRSGLVRTVLLVGVIASGIGMVLKNLSGVRFSMELTIIIDLVHMGLAMAFMLVALYCLIVRAKWTAPVTR